jgi:hypothetical protein
MIGSENNMTLLWNSFLVLYGHLSIKYIIVKRIEKTLFKKGVPETSLFNILESHVVTESP